MIDVRPGITDSPPPDVDVLIEEAHRRHRKRQFAIALGLLLVIGLALGITIGFDGGSKSVGKSLESPARATPFVNAKAFAHEGLLAFTSDARLYVLSAKTGSVRQVGTAAAGAEEPTFSHDGHWLAYIAAGKETRTSFGLEAPYAPFTGPLVIAAANGSGARRITAVGTISSLSWSPTTDELLVVAGANSYYGTAVWVVSPSGQARRIFTGPTRSIYNSAIGSVSGAVWSPDGESVALGVQNPRSLNSTTVETIAASGGTPTVWATSAAQDEQWLIPLGWWKGSGIGLWSGGNGSTPDGDGSLDGANLLLARSPGAPLLSLGKTPPIAETPVATSRSGWLAVDEGGDRDAWSEKSVEMCRPATATCLAVREPASVTSYDPVWSSSGDELLFVKAPMDEGLTYTPQHIESWYNASELEVVRTGQTTATPVPHTLGATAPQWSPNGGLTYVANDYLYLVRAIGDTPVRIAGPLLPKSEWSSAYYGGIDWRFLFSWTTQ